MIMFGLSEAGRRFLSRLPHEAWLKFPSAEPLQGPSSCHVSPSSCMLLLDTWHLKSFCFTTSIWWLRWFFVLTRKSPVFFCFYLNLEELSGDAQAHAVSWKNGGPQSWKMDTKACDSVIVMSKNSWWIIKTNLWCGGNVVINGWKIHRDCRLQEPLCCQSLCHYCTLVVNWYSFLNLCLA